MKWLRTGLRATGVILLVLVVCPLVAQADTATDVSVSATGLVVASPGGFTVYYISEMEVGLSWTMPDGADKIMIRAKYGSYPDAPAPGAEPTDGYLVYYGTGTSTSDTAVSLEENAAGVYYRAFIQTAGGAWSPTYAEGFIEGGGMTLIAFFLFCGIMTYIGARSSYYILKFFSGFVWLFMFSYWIYAPPAAISAGSYPHVIGLVVFFGLAFAMFFMPLWYSKTAEVGRFRLPLSLGGRTEEEEEEVEAMRATRTNYRARRDNYMERLNNAGRGRRLPPR